MSKFEAYYEARQHVVRYLVRSLQGDERDNVINETPNARFGVGKLYPVPTARNVNPAAVDVATELSDTTEQASEVDSEDYGPSLSHLPKPSSIGITFSIDAASVEDVVIEVTYVRYRTASGVVDTDFEIEPETDKESRVVRDSGAEWVANRVSQKFKISELFEGTAWTAGRAYKTVVLDKDTLSTSVAVLRRSVYNGVVSLTVSLVNRATVVGERSSKSFNEAMIFRPQITVRTTKGVFVQGEDSVGRELNLDDAANELLYRGNSTLAIGHGCAVTWPEGSHVSELSSTFFPQHELQLASPQIEERFGNTSLCMAQFGEGRLENAELLVEAYESWIIERETDLESLSDRLKAQGRTHIAEAKIAANRIRNGIRVIKNDPQVARAFRLMNQSMFNQRRQQVIAKGKFNNEEAFSAEWFPFQLAFILMNLESLSDSSSEERELVELLWFPTGGGKTEAYLGLIAFSIFLRRIRNPRDAGVSVIMRYTLRLLTIQQFERAAALICAMENLRRQELPEAEKISIGLWVGSAATPNSIKDAQTALNKHRDAKNSDEYIDGDPVQISACPWCNCALSSENYFIEEDSMIIRCADLACPFAESLPIFTVDDDVYENRPSLVIGTVDKFAAIAWEERVRNIFSADQTNSSPDLIIQDELHLISGPLGSMVGLYEVPIMAAAGRTAPVKVIASTATIRNVKSQGLALYGRDTFQFPPPGLLASDSFFAHDASRNEKGTRLYVGVSAPNLSQATLLIRVYSALLQAVSELPEDTVSQRQAKDSYWTLLGYFNALRILGGAVLQVYDDIPERIKYQSGLSKSAPRELHSPEELTSRKNSGQLTATLKALGSQMGSVDALDVVLATNMVSVGVDVDRLGLMVVDGQPKTTAEYIQSTSRVGRSTPGLVVTMLNANRSRDISHFENFVAYHRALYRYVEPTSATPFALRSLDRGLHGALVGMARLSFDEFAANAGAGKIIDQQDALRDAATAFDERAKKIGIDPEERWEINEQLEDLVELWYGTADHLNEENKELYFFIGNGKGDSLLRTASVRSSQDADVFPPMSTPWSTMRSLRNVDATVRLVERLPYSRSTTSAPKPARKRQR